MWIFSRKKKPNTFQFGDLVTTKTGKVGYIIWAESKDDTHYEVALISPPFINQFFKTEELLKGDL